MARFREDELRLAIIQVRAVGLCFLIAIATFLFAGGADIASCV
ncbi:MAG TPA: hypothetical protein VEO19_12715 [Terriglobia bacterium]|nr:hypothetical protein [Terriglobia bacterium]